MGTITPEYVDTDAASQLTGFSPKTLVTWRSRGGGPPFIKRGASVKYAVAELRAWMSAGSVRSTSEYEAA